MNKMQMIAANSTLLSARPGPGDNANAVRRQFAQSAKPVDCRTADILPARCRHGTPVSFFPIFVHCSLVIGRSADAFGNTIIFSAPDTTGNWWGDAAVQSNYGANGIIYCGYRYDAETENYYVRNRYYSPALGRWITRDPIGYDGGINLYGYVESSPVGAADTFGEVKGDIKFVNYLEKNII